MNIMEKKLVLLITILVVGLVTIRVLPSSAEQIVNQEFLQNNEREVVESAIKSGMIFINQEFLENPDWNVSEEQLPAIAGTPYKVYPIDPEKFKNMNADSCLRDFIKGSYEWEFPILTSEGEVISVGSIAFLNGAWQFVGLGLTIPQSGVELSSKPDQIIELLEKEDLVVNFTDFKHIRWGLPPMDLLVVTANSQEYVVPIYYQQKENHEDGRIFPVLDKIKPMQVYKANYFINLIEAELSNADPHMTIIK